MQTPTKLTKPTKPTKPILYQAQREQTQAYARAHSSAIGADLVGGDGYFGGGGGCFGRLFRPDAFLDLAGEGVGVRRTGKVGKIVETVVDDAQGLRRLRRLRLSTKERYKS